MAQNTGGPWGGGSGGGPRGPKDEDGEDGDRTGGSGGAGGHGHPEIDRIMRKGQEQLRVLMGGRGGQGGGSGGGGPRGPSLGGNPLGNRTTWALGGLAALAVWAFASFYSVKPEEASIELLLGRYYTTGSPGLNFAPWPFVTAEVISVTNERTEDIGVASSPHEQEGLMLTTDENIVDIDFQVVWNINDPAAFLFTLRDPQMTIRAVSESVMFEIIAATELAPILNRDRGIIANRAHTLIQQTLDSYGAGVTILRVNLNKADPPVEVIDSFRDVQAAEQERDRSEREADAYANRVLADARGQAATSLEGAEGYRARVVNEAEGDSSRFLAVLAEYRLAPEVTRRRLYLETMEKVLEQVSKIVLDDGVTSGQGVLPFLPLVPGATAAPAGTGVPARAAATATVTGGN